MSQPVNLYRLQQVDSQLDQAQARLKEIAAALAEDAALLQAQADVQAAAQAEELAQKGLRRAEDEAKAQQIKIEQNQAALYSGRTTNPKELQDLQLEAEALRRHLGTLEDQQLEKMAAYEDAQSIQQQANTSLKSVEAGLAAQHAELIKEQAALLKDVDRLQTERAATAANVTAESAQVYDRLRTSRGGVAVARVADKTCTACGTTLSQALAQAARSPNQLTHCDTCGRILYSP